MKIEFNVNGTPKPGGSKKYVGKNKMGHAILADMSKNQDWRADVKRACEENHTGDPLFGPLSLTVEFRMPRPLGHFGSLKNPGGLKKSAPIYCAKQPDATKLLRSTEDAISDSGLWKDDALVVIQHATKRYCNPDERPGAFITIETAQTVAPGG